MIPASTSLARNLIWKAGDTDREPADGAALGILPVNSRFCKGVGISRWPNEDMRYGLPGELPGSSRGLGSRTCAIRVNAGPLLRYPGIVSRLLHEKKFFKLCNRIDVFLLG
jgi:hypothetical protein